MHCVNKNGSLQKPNTIYAGACSLGVNNYSMQDIPEDIEFDNEGRVFLLSLTSKEYQRLKGTYENS